VYLCIELVDGILVNAGIKQALAEEGIAQCGAKLCVDKEVAAGARVVSGFGLRVLGGCGINPEIAGELLSLNTLLKSSTCWL